LRKALTKNLVKYPETKVIYHQPKDDLKTHTKRKRQTRLYLNNLPGTNANFRDNQTAKKDRKLNAQRLALAAGCHENEPTKRENDFERKNALKRNVANRPTASNVGRF